MAAEQPNIQSGCQHRDTGQMRKVLMRRLQRSVVRFVAVAVIVMIASVACSAAPPTELDPGEPAISTSHPTGGSRVDFPVDRFDLCSPFSHPLFMERAPVTQAPVELDQGSCRWRGKGVTATIFDETGATLAEISSDPRYRPGYTGLEGNRYWVTVTPKTPPYAAHLFLAAGPSQSRRLLHIHVETETERVRAPQPNRSYTAGLLAELIAACTYLRMSEVPLGPTAPAPR